MPTSTSGRQEQHSVDAGRYMPAVVGLGDGSWLMRTSRGGRTGGNSTPDSRYEVRRTMAGKAFGGETNRGLGRSWTRREWQPHYSFSLGPLFRGTFYQSRFIRTSERCFAQGSMVPELSVAVGCGGLTALPPSVAETYPLPHGQPGRPRLNEEQ